MYMYKYVDIKVFVEVFIITAFLWPTCLFSLCIVLTVWL